MIEANMFIIKKIRFILATLIFMTAVGVYAQTDRQLIREGNRMFHQQKYDKAEVLYRKAVATKNSNPQAVYNLGCALMMQGKDSAAIAQYTNAAKIERNKLRLAQVYHNIGVICQNHQMYEDAIKAYEQALRNNPKDDETRYNLVLCKRMQKKQPQNNNDKNNKQKKGNKNDSKNNKNQDNDDKQKDESKRQKQEEKMSKENAEQLLNAAMQNEKQTQKHLKEAQRRQSSRHLQKNW